MKQLLVFLLVLFAFVSCEKQEFIDNKNSDVGLEESYLVFSSQDEFDKTYIN